MIVMGDSLAQTTREVASAMIKNDRIASVKRHNGSIGAIDFHIERDSGLSQRSVDKMVPDGWKANIVATAESFTSVYVSKE